MYADIAVCLPLVRTFVYRVNQSVETGCRVIVPFRKREVEGFVVGLREDAPRDLEVHDIGSVVDQSSLLRPDIFQLHVDERPKRPVTTEQGSDENVTEPVTSRRRN